LDEMKGKSVVTARDRFGSRVVQQLIKSCSHEQISDLVVELMADGKRLLRHPYANYTMQCILRFGSPAQQALVVDALVGDLQGLSKHRVAKYVYRLALELCCREDQDRLKMGSQS